MPLVTRFPGRAPGPADRVAGFMAHLRENGLAIGVAETAAALEALSVIDPTDLWQARRALKAVCTGCADDHARFDDLFDGYWRNRGRERTRPASRRQDGSAGTTRNTRRPLVEAMAQGGAGRTDTPDPDGEGEADRDGTGRLAGSKVRNMMRKDLREFLTPEDVAEAEAVAFRLARAIRDRRSRRWRAAKSGARPDLRRIARGSLASGGEPLRLYWRARPDRPARLTVLCDVSGSMQVYARVFLAFVRGLAGADLRTDAYLFHTRLIRITDALQDGDTLRAAARLSMLADGFGGGTRIGGALDTFVRGYARRLVGSRNVVLILSDGYDSGDPDRIGPALAALSRRGCRIVWLNPLKGWRGFEPVARGMAAAMPHLDLFAAANTLQSLADLEPDLARI